MTAKNPFGQLNIKRDDDDEETQTTNVAKTSVNTGSVLFAPAVDQKKKKKVRPEEVPKKENLPEYPEESEEGFSVVRKKVPTKQRHTGDIEETVEEKGKHPKQNKGAFIERNSKVTPGKRLHDRQSGTGRGKEISKGGAGGKHTWGTKTDVIARNAEKHYEGYNEDESYFNNALNPKPKAEKKEVEVIAEDVVEEVKVEDATAQKEGVTEGEDQGWDRRNRKKKGGEVEVSKEDLLERPENALSLNEYLEQLKQKNSNLNAQTKVVGHAKEESDLKVQEKAEVDDMTVGQKKQIKTKTKEKKPDPKQQEIVIPLKTGDDFERKYDNKERTYGQKKGPKFNFSSEEFPEL